MQLGVILGISLLLVNVSQAKTIEIDGEQYSCEKIEEKGNGNAGSCVNKAYSGPFSKSESIQLCDGARNNGPADCALLAYSGPFSKSESIKLCQGVRSKGPGECAILAYQGPFSKTESLELCNHPRATKQTAQCALEAYAGPYSKSESIKICKEDKRGRGLVEESSFKQLELSELATFESTKKDMDSLLKEVNEKAFKNNEYK
ncbi:MAG: hypothetical protein M9962_09295 [Oligoflexia bacterium]|nr:hypothetical protein [Oligoflexia bacterium]